MIYCVDFHGKNDHHMRPVRDGTSKWCYCVYNTMLVCKLSTLWSCWPVTVPNHIQKCTKTNRLFSLGIVINVCIWSHEFRCPQGSRNIEKLLRPNAHSIGCAWFCDSKLWVPRSSWRFPTKNVEPFGMAVPQVMASSLRFKVTWLPTSEVAVFSS